MISCDFFRCLEGRQNTLLEGTEKDSSSFRNEKHYISTFRVYLDYASHVYDLTGVIPKKQLIFCCIVYKSSRDMYVSAVSSTTALVFTSISDNSLLHA